MKKRIIVFVTGFIVSCFANATVSDDLSRLLNGIQTMQSNFKQTVYDNKGKAIQKSVGRMALQRPGKFRWQVDKPMPQLIVANEKKLMIYDPDLQQVTIKPMNHAAADTPALLLSEVDTNVDKDYTVTTVSSKSDLNSFKLIPKNADSMFASVVMSFSGDKILSMDLEDHLGHTTKIQFLNPKTNATLASSLFSLKPPAGADVVDETKRR